MPRNVMLDTSWPVGNCPSLVPSEGAIPAQLSVGHSAFLLGSFLSHNSKASLVHPPVPLSGFIDRAQLASLAVSWGALLPFT